MYLFPKCKVKDLFLSESGNQKGLYCGDCGAWIKWVGNKELSVVGKYWLKSEVEE